LKAIVKRIAAAAGQNPRRRDKPGLVNAPTARSRQPEVRCRSSSAATATVHLAEGSATRPPGANATIMQACFAAGTKVMSPAPQGGCEDFTAATRYFRNEFEPAAHRGKDVEKLFNTHGRVWHLHGGGQVIGQRTEHPSSQFGKGVGEWSPTAKRRPVMGHDGQCVAVEDLLRITGNLS